MLTRRSLLLLIPILMMGVLLTSCRSQQQPETVIDRDGSLRLQYRVSRTQVGAGESVELQFTAKNIGEFPEVIRIEDKSVMDIKIRLDHYSDWSYLYWSDGREITREMRTLELTPGESKTIEMTWTIPEGQTDGFPALTAGVLRRGDEETRVQMLICVGNCGKA